VSDVVQRRGRGEEGKDRRTFLFDDVSDGGLGKDLGNLVEVAVIRGLEEVREHDSGRKSEELRGRS
jgi:hypothetical protein